MVEVVEVVVVVVFYSVTKFAQLGTDWLRSSGSSGKVTVLVCGRATNRVRAKYDTYRSSCGRIGLRERVYSHV